MTSGALFNVFWAIGITVIFSLVIGINIIGHMMHGLQSIGLGKEKSLGFTDLSVFSRGKVVQVFGKDGNLVRLTHLRNKESKLFQHVEIQNIDMLGQSAGKPVLREGDFDDLVDEMAGIPEGSLAHGYTPEYPDPSKAPRETQALKKLRYLPKPLSLKALPSPTMH